MIMRFDSWEPIYQEILEDFGFSRDMDEEAAEILSSMLPPSEPILREARGRISGRNIVVCGNAPSLAEEIGLLQKTAGKDDCTFIAADGAAAVLLRAEIVPAIIVTDLDGPFPEIRRAHDWGSLVVVHAHGDNLDSLRRYVPSLRRVMGTTQSRPLKNVFNFGGFTDGDRCVFLAKALGAASIKLIGFDFDDERVTPRKKKKLAWAKRLIEIALSQGSG
jgi:2-amino-4-hydroxy-6-hydroxymethyldihydropteridine diphosphokinase